MESETNYTVIHNGRTSNHDNITDAWNKAKSGDVIFESHNGFIVVIERRGNESLYVGSSTSAPGIVAKYQKVIDGEDDSR